MLFQNQFVYDFFLTVDRVVVQSTKLWLIKSCVCFQVWSATDEVIPDDETVKIFNKI